MSRRARHGKSKDLRWPDYCFPVHQPRSYSVPGQIIQSRKCKRLDNSRWLTHWLQIDLRDRSIRITRVATQGRYSYDQWVTMYQLQYGDDEVTFQYYRDKQAVIKMKYICSLKLTFFFHLNPVLRSFSQPDNTLYNNAAKGPFFESPRNFSGP